MFMINNMMYTIILLNKIKWDIKGAMRYFKENIFGLEETPY